MRDLLLAELTGGHIHLQHVSTQFGVDAIRRGIGPGLTERTLRRRLARTLLAGDPDCGQADLAAGLLLEAGERDRAAQTLAATKMFPKLALQMINVGEETGQLDAMLLKVADTYDSEVRTAIDRMMALFVPLLTLGLAVMVAMIVMSILMAILSINDLIG